LAQLVDAAAADVGIPIRLCDLPPLPGDGIDDESLSRREVAEREVRRIEAPNQRVEQDSACYRQVGASRFESRDAQAFLERQAHQLLLDAPQLLGRHATVAQ